MPLNICHVRMKQYSQYVCNLIKIHVWKWCNIIIIEPFSWNHHRTAYHQQLEQQQTTTTNNHKLPQQSPPPTTKTTTNHKSKGQQPSSFPPPRCSAWRCFKTIKGPSPSRREIPQVAEGKKRAWPVMASLGTSWVFGHDIHGNPSSASKLCHG